MAEHESPVKDSRSNKKKEIIIGAVAAVVLCVLVWLGAVLVQCFVEPVPGANSISTFSEKCTRFATKRRTENNGFRWSVKMEVGGKQLEVADFCKEDAPADAAFAPGTDTTVSATLGAYRIVLCAGGEEYVSWLLVQDTTPPAVKVQDVILTIGTQAEVEEFIVSTSDQSAVTAAYASKPDFGRMGEQDVAIVVSDASGNKTEVTARLTVREKDTVAPVITGAEDRTVTVGETVMYRSGVSATDDMDGELDFEVDTSAVDAATPGSYPVTYTAVDAAGNETSVTVTFQFIQMTTSAPPQAINPADYNLEELTRKVYNQIIHDGMTPHQKAEAIYNWTRYKILYTGYSDKSNWENGAILGFVTKRGDCFTYFATAKSLLQMAGIPTIDVRKIVIEGRSRHYWLLVDLGEGWYHFDSCPRNTGGRFFLWTDAQMLEYSEKYKDCFDFDLRLYPRTPGTVPDRFLIKFYPEWFDANGNRLVDANGNLAGTAGYTPTAPAAPVEPTPVVPVEPDPVVPVEPEPGTEAAPETEQETVPEAEPGTETGTGTETEIGTETGTETEAEIELEEGGA